MVVSGRLGRMRVFLGVCYCNCKMSWSLTEVEYSFTVPHDMQTLIEFMGGKDTFESRLDQMVCHRQE